VELYLYGPYMSSWRGKGQLYVYLYSSGSAKGGEFLDPLSDIVFSRRILLHTVWLGTSMVRQIYGVPRCVWA
jgi:hypothetical protein